MVMEFYQNGDLFSLISNTGKFDPSLSKHFFMQILDAIEILHE
jgi:serine/threonine protein kinase